MSIQVKQSIVCASRQTSHRLTDTIKEDIHRSQKARWTDNVHQYPVIKQQYVSSRFPDVSLFPKHHSFLVLGWIFRILKLLENDTSGNLPLQFFSLPNGTWHPFRPRCENDFCTICLYQFPAFYAHRFRHVQYQMITLDSCH